MPFVDISAEPQPAQSEFLLHHKSSEMLLFRLSPSPLPPSQQTRTVPPQGVTAFSEDSTPLLGRKRRHPVPF